MKTKFNLILGFCLFVQGYYLCQQKIVPFYLIIDGDSINSYQNVKLQCFTRGKYETILVDGTVNFHEIKYENIENITLIVNNDTLVYYDANQTNPLLKQVASSNYKCFFELAEYWVLFIDKYPFQLDAMKFVIKIDNNKKYYSLRVKGCLEQINTTKD